MTLTELNTLFQQYEAKIEKEYTGYQKDLQKQSLARWFYAEKKKLGL